MALNFHPLRICSGGFCYCCLFGTFYSNSVQVISRNREEKKDLGKVTDP